MDCGQSQQVFFGFRVWRFFYLSGEIKIIPADDTVFDQPVAGLCDFLFFLFCLGKFARASYGHGAGKAVGQLNLVELFFDGLTQCQVVNVAQDEQGFDDLTESLECLIKGVLSRV